MLTVEKMKLLKLLALFSILAIIFWVFTPGVFIWYTLVVCGIGWFLVEFNKHKEKKSIIKKALMIGLFLMVFDFAVENTGKVFGLWETHESLFFVLYVPIEIMILCTFGGAAWALYLPENFDKTHAFLDILVFSFFGALGEFIIMKNNLMSYGNGWTSYHAFIGYAITWMILHFINYKVIKVKS
jgi:hypothetical protein